MMIAMCCAVVDQSVCAANSRRSMFDGGASGAGRGERCAVPYPSSLAIHFRRAMRVRGTNRGDIVPFPRRLAFLSPLLANTSSIPRTL